MSNEKERQYTVGEEIASSLTHGAGAVLSVAALVIMVVYAAAQHDPWRIVSVSVFGGTLILMYLASTLYHALPYPCAKRWLQICDHCAIYLLIAGTYTPFMLVSLRGPWGWSLFGVVWGIAVVGCVFKALSREGYDKPWWNWVSSGLYVAMGWLVLVALKPVMDALPAGGFWLLALGGVSYTGGVLFFMWEKLPYNHAIWHLFVLGGSAAHFFAVLYFVVPVA